MHKVMVTLGNDCNSRARLSQGRAGKEWSGEVVAWQLHKQIIQGKLILNHKTVASAVDIIH